MFFEKSPGNVHSDTFYVCVRFHVLFDNLGFRIMKLGSEGVYLHEKCGTNASKHLPGPKTTVKTLKKSIWWSGGGRAEILYVNSRSTASSGLYA